MIGREIAWMAACRLAHPEAAMIGLVGVRPPSGTSTGIRLLEGLPAPPASEVAAMAVFCETKGGLVRVLGWFAEIRATRRAFPLIIVAAPERWGATLATTQHPVLRVVPPTEMEGEGLPQLVLDELREASVEGRVLDRLVLRFGARLLDELPVVRSLISHGVRGGTVSRAARDLILSPDTVQRHMARVGVLPRDFVRAARILAYEEHRRHGTAAPIALAACGWTDPDHLRRAKRRDEGAANRGG
jgi:hypothetical protein